MSMLTDSMFFFLSLGLFGSCETDFVKFWVNFDQNNAKEGQPKFDKLKVGGLILMVK